MGIDAIIISDYNTDSLSGSNPLKLSIDGKTANVQIISNYLQHNGNIVLPIKGDGLMSWSSAYKLNGIYLLSFLKKQNFKVELINNFYEEKEHFSNLIKESPMFVIISTTFFFNKKKLCKMINEIRSITSDIIIIAGGAFVFFSYLVLKRSDEPHFEADALKNDFLFFDHNDPAADLYIVSQRGEQILCEALKRIKAGKNIDGMPNTARLIKNNYIFTDRIDDIGNVDEIRVDWDLIPDYVFKSGVVPIQASTGCPYKCSFCTFTKEPRLMSYKKNDELIMELREVTMRGAKLIWFTDDNFRLGKTDINDFCHRLIAEDLSIKWMSFIRADALEHVDFKLLKKSGCKELRIGAESADNKILKNMNKKTNSNLYQKVIKKLLIHGINCTCYFIFGFPGETNETIDYTISFIKKFDNYEDEGIFSWSIYPFLLAPMSPIYESEMREKYLISGFMHNWTHRTMNSSQANGYVLKAFNEFKHISTVYRGDNQDVLDKMTPIKQKQFISERHKLTKLSMDNKLAKEDIIKSFTPFFLS